MVLGMMVASSARDCMGMDMDMSYREAASMKVTTCLWLCCGRGAMGPMLSLLMVSPGLLRVCVVRECAS